MFLHLLADSKASVCTEGPVLAGSYIRSRLVCVQHAPYCPVPLSRLRNVDDIRLVAQTPSSPPPIVPARNVMQRLQYALSGDDDDCSHIMVGHVRSGLKMN